MHTCVVNSSGNVCWYFILLNSSTCAGFGGDTGYGVGTLSVQSKFSFLYVYFPSCSLNRCLAKFSIYRKDN